MHPHHHPHRVLGPAQSLAHERHQLERRVRHLLVSWFESVAVQESHSRVADLTLPFVRLASVGCLKVFVLLSKSRRFFRSLTQTHPSEWHNDLGLLAIVLGNVFGYAPLVVVNTVSGKEVFRHDSEYPALKDNRHQRASCTTICTTRHVLKTPIYQLVWGLKAT
jgi:hypothetical protein